MNGIKGQTNQTAEEKWLCLRRKHPTRRQKYTLNEKSLTLVILLYSISNKNPTVNLKNNQNITDIHLTLSLLYQNRLMTKIIFRSFKLREFSSQGQKCQWKNADQWNEENTYLWYFPQSFAKLAWIEPSAINQELNLTPIESFLNSPASCTLCSVETRFSLHVQKRHLKSVLCVNIPIGPQH